MSDAEFWVAILGSGSFGLGRDEPTWRGPAAFKITLEQAVGVLAWKEKRPAADWLVLSTQEPHLPDDQLTGTLELADVKFGSYHPARPEPDLEQFEPADDDQYEPADDQFACEQCGTTFMNAPGLRRHIMVNHSTTFATLEEQARAEVERVKTERATQERIERTPNEKLHPAERDSLHLGDESAHPNLWPGGLG